MKKFKICTRRELLTKQKAGKSTLSRSKRLCPIAALKHALSIMSYEMSKYHS